MNAENVYNDERVAPALRGRLDQSEIGAAYRQLSDVERSFKRGDDATRPEAIRQVDMVKQNIENLEREAAAIETQIAYRSPGGKLYIDKMVRVDEDRRRCELILTSANLHEQRLAQVRIDGLDKIVRQWDDDMAELKARLKAIRG